MNMLYRGQSVAARGTIAQLKGFFGHRSLKKDVMQNYQHVWDMIEVKSVNGCNELHFMKSCEHVHDTVAKLFVYMQNLHFG